MVPRTGYCAIQKLFHSEIIIIDDTVTPSSDQFGTTFHLLDNIGNIMLITLDLSFYVESIKDNKYEEKIPT